MENVRVSHEAHLVSIAHLSITIGAVNTLYMHHRSSTWPNILRASSARVSFIDRNNLVVHIKNKEPVGLLAHYHNVVFVPEQAILVESVRHSLQRLRELLLSQIDEQLAFVFLVKVLLLVELLHVHVLGPVADSGCVGKSRAT